MTLSLKNAVSENCSSWLLGQHNYKLKITIQNILTVTSVAHNWQDQSNTQGRGKGKVKLVDKSIIVKMDLTNSKTFY